jgi:hypothetical protein
MEKLQVYISQLEKFISDQHIAALAVSSGNIGWHIEHCLLTLDIVAEKIKGSDPSTYKPKFHFWKTLILTFKKLPRGKVKAPKIVQPNNDHSEVSLQNHLAITRANISSLTMLGKNNYFIHPFLGPMNFKQTIRFLEIHTMHHIGIIKEIKNLSR